MPLPRSIDFSFTTLEGQALEITVALANGEVIAIKAYDNLVAHLIDYTQLGAENLIALLDKIEEALKESREDVWRELTNCVPNESRAIIRDCNNSRGIE